MYGDRGGHNQAEENSKWEEIENSTLKKIIKMSQGILQTKFTDKEYSESETMEHICIIEVNHFPGLAFNSTDSNTKLLEQWAHNNKSLINKMIDFYEPSIIISSRDVMSLFIESHSADGSAVDVVNYMTARPYKDFSLDNGYPNATFWDRKIQAYYNESNINADSSYKRTSKYGPVALELSQIPWIAWCHPGARQEMSNNNQKYICSWITNLLTSKSLNISKR